jgi:hypothetical protein
MDLTDIENQELILVKFDGSGIFNTNGNYKNRFNDKDIPYEYISMLDEIDGLANDIKTGIEKDKDMLNKLIKDFEDKIKNVQPYLSYIKVGYINFLQEYLVDASDQSLQYNNSLQYKEIEKMIFAFFNTFSYRCKYYIENMDLIKKNILKHIDIILPSKGGKIEIIGLGKESLIESSQKSSSKILYQNDLSSSKISKSSQKESNMEEIYERIINIPFINNTKIKDQKDIKEPYLSYYKNGESEKVKKVKKVKKGKKSKKVKNYDISNEGFCISKEEFDSSGIYMSIYFVFLFVVASLITSLISIIAFECACKCAGCISDPIFI